MNLNQIPGKLPSISQGHVRQSLWGAGGLPLLLSWPGLRTSLAARKALIGTEAWRPLRGIRCQAGLRAASLGLVQCRVLPVWARGVLPSHFYVFLVEGGELCRFLKKKKGGKFQLNAFFLQLECD